MDFGNGGKPFDSILLVAEDKQHLCIDGIRERAKQPAGRQLRIFSSTVLEDICHLVHARNLLISDSSFAALALLLNTGLKRLLRFDGKEHWNYAGAQKPCMIELTEAWQQSNP